MTSDVETLSQLALIDKIRKEISQKCLKVRIGLYQTVELPKVKIESITPSTSTLQIQESTIEDILGEPDVTVSPLPSPSLPITKQDLENESNCDEPLVHSEVKPELHKNSKLQLPPKSFLRDSSTRKFCCPSCDKTFGTKQYAQTHYESVHLNKTWKCDICNVILSKHYSNILKHKKNCRKMIQRRNERERSRQHYKFQCVTCGKRFPAKFLLQSHYRYAHSKTQIACGTCNKTFKCRQTLQSHRKNIHLAVDVSCKYCSAKFKTFRACKNHQNKCPQRSVLKTEAKSAPQPILIEETGMYRCPSCTKTYPRPSTVRLHYNSVHLKKKINCDLCNIADFTDPSSLKHHKKTCLDTLQKRLKDLELRKSYQFQCQSCNKKFRTRRCLTSHKSVAHASMRRFQCDHCEKSFKTGAQLRVHRDSVHLKKTYPCKYCNKVLNQSSFYKHDKNCRMKKNVVKVEVTGS